jgi:hypothetical protein
MLKINYHLPHHLKLIKIIPNIIIGSPEKRSFSEKKYELTHHFGVKNNKIKGGHHQKTLFPGAFAPLSNAPYPFFSGVIFSI